MTYVGTDLEKVVVHLDNHPSWVVTRPGRWINERVNRIIETQFVRGEATVILTDLRRNVINQVRGQEVYDEFLNLLV